MKITIPPGFSTYSAYKLAKEVIDSENVSFVEFDFNDINLCVQRGSVYGDIATIYDLKCEIRRLKGV